MIRSRAGRARFTSNHRATVRGYPLPEEDPVKTARSVETPADLAQACIDAGAHVRRTQNQGWMVRGLSGTATIPRAWAHGRGRQNVLSDVRAAGVCLDAVDADAQEVQAAVGGGKPSPAVMPPRKLVLPNHPRPRLAYSSQPDDDPDATPEPETGEQDGTPPPQEETTVEQTAEQWATRADVETLLDLVDVLSGRLDVVTRRLDRAERALQEDGPSRVDMARQLRTRILAWFGTLPPGMKVPAAVVITNLGMDDDAASVRRSLSRLAELGQLVAHGASGKPGGNPSLYALPTEQDQEGTADE